MDRTASCPACSQRLLAEDAFCGACGAKVGVRTSRTGSARSALVRQTVATLDRVSCRSCNSLVLPTDTFCSTCGAATAAAPVAGMWAGILRQLEDANAGKYEFIRQLGRGGMGTVYLARDLALERLVAIKVLSPDWLANETMVERFRREAKTIARLRHPSIVTVYGVGSTADIHYFVMDYIEGASLSDVLRIHGPLSIPAVRAIAYQVGSALDYAHQPGRGIIHRDVKPSNIVLDTEGNAFVMDFGISKVTASKTGLTQTGVIMGTPEYMSPEQCQGIAVDQASDQYSFGTVVYSMLTGSPPFTGPSYQVLVAHNTKEPPDLADARPDCPPELIRAAERMLAKAPSERWPSIGQGLRSAGIGPVPSDDPVRRELAGLVLLTAERRRSSPVGVPVPPERSTGPGERSPRWLRILQVPDEVERGDSFVLKATALGPGGSEEPDRPVRWESTDPSILKVEPSTGELVAVGVGSAFVTARSGAAVQSVPIAVQPERVARLRLVPGAAEIAVGRRLQLEAAALSKRGTTLERPVFWSSSDPSMATVDHRGFVQAHAVGVATILAHCEGVAATATVGVVEAATGSGKGIDIDGETRGRSDPNRGTIGRPAGEPGTLPGDFMANWPDTAMREEAVADFMRAVGANTDVPSVERPGGDTATDAPREEGVPASNRSSRSGPGRRRLVASAAPVVLLIVGGFWLWQQLRVEARPTPVAEVSIEGPAGQVIGTRGLTLSPGDRIELVAVPHAEDGSSARDATITWASIDPSIVTLDSRGMLTALAPGSTQVSATAGDVVRRLTVHVQLPDTVAGRDSFEGPYPPTRTVEPGQLADRAALPGPPVEEEEDLANRSAPTTDPAPSGRRTADTDIQEEPHSPGTLLLIVDPWANVFVDGQPQGQRQRLRMPLPPGEHRLRLHHPERAAVDTTFTIRSDQATQLSIPMPPRTPP